MERYIRERQRAKLDAEIMAYKRLHPELYREYPGQWVAIHEQKPVDHDHDGGALYQRVRAKYGRQTAVLMRKVAETVREEIWVRTPSSGYLSVGPGHW